MKILNCKKVFYILFQICILGVAVVWIHVLVAGRISSLRSMESWLCLKTE